VIFPNDGVMYERQGESRDEGIFERLDCFIRMHTVLHESNHGVQVLPGDTELLFGRDQGFQRRHRSEHIVQSLANSPMAVSMRVTPECQPVALNK
jgi:hypothetical protein